MDIVTNKAFIDGVLYDVIPIEQLTEMPITFITDHLAVIFNGFILPVRLNVTLTKPGLYYNCFCNIVMPKPEEAYFS